MAGNVRELFQPLIHSDQFFVLAAQGLFRSLPVGDIHDHAENAFDAALFADNLCLVRNRGGSLFHPCNLTAITLPDAEFSMPSSAFAAHLFDAQTMLLQIVGMNVFP